MARQRWRLRMLGAEVRHRTLQRARADENIGPAIRVGDGKLESRRISFQHRQGCRACALLGLEDRSAASRSETRDDAVLADESALVGARLCGKCAGGKKQQP